MHGSGRGGKTGALCDIHPGDHGLRHGGGQPCVHSAGDASSLQIPAGKRSQKVEEPGRN